MEKVEINEQWKLDGDCTICRRRSYCSKVCSRNRKKKVCPNLITFLQN